ncbi:MAG: PKD domain-containing protein [Chitinispirillaceae bacterium]
MMRLLGIVALLGLMSVVGCGGSSDHDNARIMGVVADYRGNPAGDVIITLLPDDYNPLRDSAYVIEHKSLTNSLGSFCFEDIPYGTYTLTGIDHYRGVGFIKKGVQIDIQEVSLDTFSVDVNSFLVFDLERMGLAKGIAVYVPGTPIFKIIESDNASMVLPPGMILLKGYDINQDLELAVLKASDSLDVAPRTTYNLGLISSAPFYLKSETEALSELIGEVGEDYSFTARYPIRQGSPALYYRWNWGDGEISEWSEDCVASHKWEKPGVYRVQYQEMFLGSCQAFSSFLKVIIE